MHSINITDCVFLDLICFFTLYLNVNASVNHMSYYGFINQSILLVPHLDMKYTVEVVPLCM